MDGPTTDLSAVLDSEEIPVLIEHNQIIEGFNAESEPDTRVPLTLICGFLGAGKSTLLKRILTEKHGYRIAVIMNEFSDTADIEGRAIKVSSDINVVNSLEDVAEEFLELPNGCLCCSIRDTGIAAVEKLMSRKGVFDHILLETTGLADPGFLAAMFWQNEEYAEGLGKIICLDGVICVIDAVFVEKQIQEDEESEGIKHILRQIGAADVLLLNKADLVSEEDLTKTEAVLRSINATIPLYRTSHSNIELSKIMNLDAYSDRPQSILSVEPLYVHPTCNETCTERGHNHVSIPHSHTGISNIVIPIPVPVNELQLSQLDEWIRSALWEGKLPNSNDQLEVLRCKGLWWNDKGEQFVLQGVRNIYEIVKVLEDERSSKMSISGKIVFIGKGLTSSVEQSLSAIVNKQLK